MDNSKWPRLFLVCLLLMAFPIKNAHYLIPPIYVGLRLLTDGSGYGLRWLAVSVPVVLVSALSLLIDSFRGEEVNVPGMLIALFTYSTLFLVPAERFDEPVSSAVAARLTRYVAWFVIIESCIGYVQFVGSVGTVLRWDVVSGTFGILDFYYGRVSMGQIYYTFNLFCMILFLFPSYRQPLVAVAMVMGLVAIALAQSGHQTILFAFAAAVMGLMYLRRPRVMAALAALVASLFFAVYWLSPATLLLTRDWFDRVALDPKSPKWMAVATGAEILSDPKNLLLGTGLGQYSSRAALITTNEFLQVKLPPVLVGKSGYYRRGIEPAYREYEVTGEGSAIPQPCFSALSVPAEFGVLLAVLFLVGTVLYAREHFRLMRSPVPPVALTGLLSNIGLLFFVLCCAVENYAEFPQAIFLPLLLYVVSRSRAVTLEQEAQGEYA